MLPLAVASLSKASALGEPATPPTPVSLRKVFSETISMVGVSLVPVTLMVIFSALQAPAVSLT